MVRSFGKLARNSRKEILDNKKLLGLSCYVPEMEIRFRRSFKREIVFLVEELIFIENEFESSVELIDRYRY